jgi:hypothetical protein
MSTRRFIAEIKARLSVSAAYDEGALHGSSGTLDQVGEHRVTNLGPGTMT